jgi:hypothetical protein
MASTPGAGTSCTVGCITMIVIILINLALLGAAVWVVVEVLKATGVLKV